MREEGGLDKRHRKRETVIARPVHTTRSLLPLLIHACAPAAATNLWPPTLTCVLSGVLRGSSLPAAPVESLMPKALLSSLSPAVHRKGPCGSAHREQSRKKQRRTPVTLALNWRSHVEKAPIKRAGVGACRQSYGEITQVPHKSSHHKLAPLPAPHRCWCGTLTIGVSRSQLRHPWATCGPHRVYGKKGGGIETTRGCADGVSETLPSSPCFLWPRLTPIGGGICWLTMKATTSRSTSGGTCPPATMSVEHEHNERCYT